MDAERSYLNESLRKIAKGAGIGFIGTVTGTFFGYLSRMIIARWLGPGDYGLISLGFAVMSIFMVLSSLGFDAGLKRYISYYKGKGDSKRMKGSIISSIKVTLVSSIIITAILYINAEWIATEFFNDEKFIPVLKIFIIGIPFYTLTKKFVSATIGFQEVKYQVYTEYIFKDTFKLVFIASLIFLGFGTIGAAVGWVVSIIGMFFLSLYFLEKKVFSISNQELKPVPMEKELFIFSFPLIFAGLAALITSWTDTIMLGYFTTSQEVGIYNVAMPTARLLTMILGVFGLIFVPVASEMFSRNYIENLREIYSSVTKWIFSIVIPLFLLMILYSESIIRIMFSNDYIEGALAMKILAFGYFIVCVTGPTSQILHVYGRTPLVMYGSFLGAVTNFILNFFLIPIYGINGAAVATSFSLALMNALNLVFVYRISKMQPFRTNFWKQILSAIIPGSIILILTEFFIEISVLALGAMILIFLLIYSLLLLILKSFDKNDLLIMKSIEERFGLKTTLLKKLILKFL